jgi:hypothetical protein
MAALKARPPDRGRQSARGQNAASPRPAPQPPCRRQVCRNSVPPGHLDALAQCASVSSTSRIFSSDDHTPAKHFEALYHLPYPIRLPTKPTELRHGITATPLDEVRL